MLSALWLYSLRGLRFDDSQVSILLVANSVFLFVRRIMVEAIEDFAAGIMSQLLLFELSRPENVKYLELRTTPKNFENTNKRQYVDVLIDAIKVCSSFMSFILKYFCFSFLGNSSEQEW
jgi:hypothetical protein